MGAVASAGDKRRPRFLTGEELTVALLILAVVLLLGMRAWTEGERPAASASLRAPLPIAGEVLRLQTTDQAAAGGVIRAPLRALGFVRYPGTGDPGTTGFQELRLSVPEDACRRWRRVTGDDCSRPLRLEDPSFSLTWQRVQPVSLRLLNGPGWKLRPTGSGLPGGLSTAWLLEASSSSTRASVDCLPSTGFTLVTSLGRWDSHCVPGGGFLLRLIIGRIKGIAVENFKDPLLFIRDPARHDIGDAAVLKNDPSRCRIDLRRDDRGPDGAQLLRP